MTAHGAELRHSSSARVTQRGARPPAPALPSTLGRSSSLSSPPPPPPPLPAVPGRSAAAAPAPLAAGRPATPPGGRGDASDAWLVTQSLPDVACRGEAGPPGAAAAPAGSAGSGGGGGSGRASGARPFWYAPAPPGQLGAELGRLGNVLAA